MARNDDAPPSAANAPPKLAGAMPELPVSERAPRLFTVLTAVVPLVLVTCLMAADANYALSVPFGCVCFIVASVALLDLFQCFEVPDARVCRQLDSTKLVKRSLEFVAAGLAFIVSLWLAVQGSLPYAIVWAALLIPGSFLAFGIAGYRLAMAAGFADGELPLLRHYGFWLLLLHAAVYLPLLGSFSLIDPWETHYGEVAREMLARDDWLSLWWAQDGWFWSKPVLDFWLQGLSFSLLGVHYQPDQMLAGIQHGLNPHPEWAARIPIFLLTTVAGYTLYKAMSRTLHPRAGFLAALSLASMPYWYFLGHQSMTDMPYVAPLVACLAFLLLGFATDQNTRVQVMALHIGRRVYSVNACHLLLLVVLLSVLPQVCYLLSRNLTLHIDSGMLSVHADSFFAGSGGNNCGRIGNAACVAVAPRTRMWQPALLAVLWLFLLLLFVKLSYRQTHVQKLYYLAAWFCLALSAMAKGAPGLVLPLFVCFVFLAATKRWRALLDLQPAGLFLIFACLVLPWYVQMVVRHGPAFTERLLLHDMYKRAFDHVHDTNAGVDVSFRYYLWQLGYGLFPWSGLAVAGLMHWIGRQQAPDTEQGALTPAEVSSFFALWFIAAFGMFTLSGTKFHHYILPAVPPLGALTGMVLHELLGHPEQRRRPALYLAFLSCATLCALLGLALLMGGPSGLVPGGVSGLPRSPGIGSVLLCAAGVLVFVALRYGKSTEAPVASPAGPTAAWYALLGALGAWLVGRDLLAQHGEDLPGQVLLMQLFTYQYQRGWPESLDFEGSLMAFSSLSVLLFIGMLQQRSRPHATVALCALSVLWCAWGVNVYLVQAAPHWGQRASIAAYYRLRKTHEPPLIAYQMNWKGENFYTGNRVATFVKSGKPFEHWLEKQRRAGVRTLYFSTEPSRADSLKRQLGAHKRFEVLTSPRVNTRFMIARVEL